MKKIFHKIFFACILTSVLYAQQEINTEFKTKTLQVFQNLDKNKIPHGILLDFGMEFTNIQAFNGTLSDSTYTNSKTITDIYKTLLMCRARQVNTGFIPLEEYATRWYTQRQEGIITLSGQCFKYNKFTDNAYPNKINYTNNQFSDKFVGSVWQNPYEEKQLFAIAPSITKYKGLNFQVKIPSNLFLSNYPSEIQNIQVDFSDGLGYRFIAYDQLLNVSYNTPNQYTWKYKITLTNGQTLLSHSKIEIEEGLNAIEWTANNTSVAPTTNTINNLSAYYKKIIVATTAFEGTYGVANVYIKYANGGNTITKPLIVAEGFDAGVILNREQEAGDNNIDQFLFKINNSSSNLPIETNQYDIIYVDWKNGVDFIQRNAYALEAVIQWVNDNKTTNLQNVVIGQSMGGLVARYALKDMENKGLNHDTRLYISHDTPHLGANVPLSVQYNARHLRNVYVGMPIALGLGEAILPLIFNLTDGIIGIINNNNWNWINNGQPIAEVDYITPLTAFSLADVAAARQMQYNWVNRKYEIKNAIHDIWQQDLSNMGYPQGFPLQGKPIRNIAIANGSECGTIQTDSGNIMSYIKDAGRDTFLSNYIGILDAVYGAIITNPLVVATALFPGKSYWEMNFQAKYMTTLNQNKNIYHGHIKYKKKILWFIPVSITITERNVYQPSGYLPYDIYGGGNQKTNTSSITFSGSTLQSNTFGFIPTASALDIGKGTSIINDVDYRKSYIGALPPALPKNSPFQNFVTHFDRNNPSNNNSEHISFNRRNENWLQKELNIGIADEYSNCSYMCANTKITGPDLLCTSENYSAPSGGAFNNWTITQGSSLVTLTGNGTPNITLTALPDVSGAVTLSLTMGDDPNYNNSGNCGNITLTKTIWIGKPSFYLQYNYFEPQPVKSTVDMVSDQPSLSINQQGITSTQFIGIKNGFTVFNITGNYFAVRANMNSVDKVFAYATNTCGTTMVELNWLESFKQSNNTAINNNFYTIYPNPSNDIVNIDIRDKNNLPEKNTKITGELFDMMGESKSKVQITNNKATFSVRGLNKGIYVLKIYINNQVESHQIAVE